MTSKHSAFTLVELSIVLVIIGLLVGGVLTGQSLIRAAELRSITSQEQRYIAAVQTFRDKYFALPGDMTNATAYWGIAAGSTGNDATCLAAVSTTTATCNGNGDGKVLTSTGSYEHFHFWKHLANAGLIEGNYTGNVAATNSVSSSSVNVPTGRISSSLWFADYFGPLLSNVYLFDGQYDNVLMIGGLATNSYPITALLKPEEAYNIDTKLDDGRPATGRVVAFQSSGSWAGTTCTDANASTVLTANYLLTNAALSCGLVFRQAF